MISKKCISFMKILVGKPLIGICREADMGDLSFGKLITFKNYKGEEKITSSYSLHIQCPFRIVSETDSKIVVASYDMYSDDRLNIQTDTYQIENEYDEKVKEWFINNPNPIVKNVNVAACGDLTISFNGGYRLDVFINNSSKEECWRFFKTRIDKDGRKICNEHLVVLGSGDEFQ